MAAVARAGELQRQAAGAHHAARRAGAADVEGAADGDGNRFEPVEGALGRLLIEAAEEIDGEDGWLPGARTACGRIVTAPAVAPGRDGPGYPAASSATAATALLVAWAMTPAQ